MPPPEKRLEASGTDGNPRVKVQENAGAKTPSGEEVGQVEEGEEKSDGAPRTMYFTGRSREKAELTYADDRTNSTRQAKGFQKARVSWGGENGEEGEGNTLRVGVAVGKDPRERNIRSRAAAGIGGGEPSKRQNLGTARPKGKMKHHGKQNLARVGKKTSPRKKGERKGGWQPMI